jgi:hypothetical protein
LISEIIRKIIWNNRENGPVFEKGTGFEISGILGKHCLQRELSSERSD